MATKIIPSNPGWYTGYVPSAIEWQTWWSNKVDFPAPINQGGTGAQTVAAANANLQQRSLIPGGAVYTVAVLNWYGLETASAPVEVTLPDITTTTPGDWIEMVDVDYNAATYNIQVFGTGTDQIVMWGTSSNTQLVNISGARILIVSDGTKWTMKVNDGSVPAAASGALGTEKVIAYLNGVPTTLTTDQIANVSGASITYSLQWAVWFNQTPASSELLALYVAPVAYSYPANFENSFSAPPLTLPTASFVLNVDLEIGGTSTWTTIGTITIATDGTVTLATTGGIAYNIEAGSRLRVIGPATADSTIAGFAVTLKGQAPIITS